MGVNVKDLLNHLRERQVAFGVAAFHFQHVFRNNNLEPAAYPLEALAPLANKGNGEQDGSTGHQGPLSMRELLPESPRKGSRKSKSPSKKKQAKVDKDSVKAESVAPAICTAKEIHETSLPPASMGSMTAAIQKDSTAPTSSNPLPPTFVFPAGETT